MNSDSNTTKISSIRTQLLVAWVFAIIVNVGEIIAFVFFFIWMFIIAGLFGLLSYGGSYAWVFLIPGLIYSIILLVFLIPSILVMRRAGKLYRAAKRNDIYALKSLDSVGWAVVALIFTGVITGIMLLLAHGPITELDAKAVGGGSTLGADSIDKLERLKNLLDTSVINKDEFEAQKKRIMGPISQSLNTPEEELKKLKQLLDSGAITKTEYEEQKKRVLSKI